MKKLLTIGLICLSTNALADSACITYTKGWDRQGLTYTDTPFKSSHAANLYNDTNMPKYFHVDMELCAQNNSVCEKETIKQLVLPHQSMVVGQNLEKWISYKSEGRYMAAATTEVRECKGSKTAAFATLYLNKWLSLSNKNK